MVVKHFRNQEEWITNNTYFDMWILYFAGLNNDLDIKKLDSNSEEKIIYNFWNMFFNKLMVNDHMKKSTVVSTNELVDEDTRIIKVSQSIFVKQYKDKVYKLLEDNKNESVNLLDLQKEIENLTMNFSEENIYASCPNIMEMMTKPLLPNAKEFLLLKYKVDKVGDRMNILRSEDEDRLSNEEKNKVAPLLTEEDKELLSEFGQHTIECILVHTLCYLFNIENSVSVASLIDRIESSIRQHVQILRDNRNLNNQFNLDKEEDIKLRRKKLEYPFGTALVEFLISRNVIVITQKNIDDIKSCEIDEGIPKKFIKSIKKKGKFFYRDKSNFAECTFNTALLPVKLSLPMVFPPLDWKYDQNQSYLTISDLYGGYLINPTGQIYESYRLQKQNNKRTVDRIGLLWMLLIVPDGRIEIVKGEEDR